VAVASYIPWFLVQKATQSAARADTYMLDWAHFSLLGVIRELSGGGYFCSLPLLILACTGAFVTRNSPLMLAAIAALLGPLVADAVLGYYFAGRQLIFALPFLVLLATSAIGSIPRWATTVLLVPLLAVSVRYDFRQATTTREDWETPARKLATYTCVYVWGADQLPYFQVYEPGLRQCDPNHWPEEFPFVTTRYSPAVQPLPGVIALRRETVGITDIVVYRRDASLKTYGLSRFVFRP
jgi:hypothetical protein